MPLYDLNDNVVKFLGTMVTNVLPQGKREEIRAFIELGDKALASFQHPIHPAGKPKLVRETEPGQLTPEEQKVVEVAKERSNDSSEDKLRKEYNKQVFPDKYR